MTDQVVMLNENVFIVIIFISACAGFLIGIVFAAALTLYADRNKMRL
jgi:hypothetical protein